MLGTDFSFTCTTRYAVWGAANRGGVSEASGATFTDHVAGARDVYARACMYHTCVKPSGQLLYAHAQMVLSQQSSKFIFTGKGNSGGKRSVAEEWARTWV